MPDEIKSESNTIIVKTSGKVTLVLQFFTAALLAFSTCVTYNNFNEQYNWTKSVRRQQIAPDINLTSETHFSEDFYTLYITFANVGNGTAHDIWLTVTYEKNILSTIVHDFSVVGSTVVQKYILPNQKVSCSIGMSNLIPEIDSLSSNQKAYTVLGKSFVFYFSYFDTDNNEYLLVEKVPPTALSGPLILQEKDTALDTLLLSLAEGVPDFSKKLIKDPDIRSESRWIKPKWGVPIDKNKK
jgi:hypothetical protein